MGQLSLIVCGNTRCRKYYVPARSDSLYCSGACKQQVYRTCLRIRAEQLAIETAKRREQKRPTLKKKTGKKARTGKRKRVA